MKGKNMDYAYLGMRIKHKRKERRMTQGALAEYSDISIQHMCNIENGKTKLSVDCLVNIANALDVTLNDLIGDNVQANKAIYINEIADIVNECSARELRDLLYLIKDAKRMISGRRYEDDIMI